MYIDVVFMADSQVRRPLITAIRSVLNGAAALDQLRITVVTHGFVDLAQARDDVYLAGQQLVQIERVEGDLDHLPAPTKLGRWTQTVYGALFVCDFVPPDCTRCIYLDTDVLVRTSLSSLSTMSMGSLAVAAVEDFPTPKVSGRNGVQAWAEIGLDPETSNFNSGVIVFDVSNWRRLELRTAALTYIERYGPIMTMADQEAFNAAVKGSYVPLDCTWNSITTWDRTLTPPRAGLDTRLAGREVRIRHFAGWRKPWMTEWADQPHADEYRLLWPT